MDQPSQSSASRDDLLASILRADPLDVRAIRQAGALALHEAASAHDVLPLVADRLALAPGLPDDLRELFLEELHRITAVDLATEAELRRLHVAFADRGVPLLLVKGSHLAYSHYARPELRARIDSDLLIAMEQREVADDIFLARLGYEAPAKLSGDLTATQKQYVKQEHGATVHIVDLHWRLASPQAFAHVLSFEELYATSVALPALGPGARGPSPVHALLIACMHRIAHHHDEADRLKWLLDIHVIASAFTRAEWDAFVALAAEREIAAVSLDSLRRAEFWFHTVIPGWVLDDPRLAGAHAREGTAAFLHVRPKAREVLDDLRALPRWRDRARLMREHLFPGADYMRNVYAPESRAPLAVLYATRIARGMVRWLS